MRPRYEFRAWNGVSDAAEALRRAASDSTSETIRDCYVLAQSPSLNAKIRGQRLDVKRLIRRCNDLEQWKPDWSEEAPFSAEAVERLFEDLGRRPPAAGDSGLDVDAFVGLLRSRLDAAWVIKRRNHHRFHSVLAEATDIEIERTREVLSCVTLESEDPGAVIEARRRIGLEGVENVPVHLAVARSLED